ncbi:hypothetical protein [Neorhizobium sp. T6_25]|uniref:hypothetical protein n=1 Tax=Neorhizobium sp. T6_25 TaxID=2093833 RepID=UPI000CF9D714|nr:hypothetical protein [Neorhizobium sp. T6_25]
MDNANDLASSVAAIVARSKQTRVMLEKVRKHINLVYPSDEATFKLRDALCLPVLGGIMRSSEKNTPSPTFTKASLELAIKKGQLKPTWKLGKLHVRVGDVKAWIAASDKEFTAPSIRLVYEAPEIRSNRQKQQAISSQEQLKAKLVAAKAAQKKERK